VKLLCNKCSQLAVWCYMPRDGIYYCEGCVPRGCSCMVKDDGTPEQDEQGRELPCCEYDYNEKGFRFQED